MKRWEKWALSGYIKVSRKNLRGVRAVSPYIKKRVFNTRFSKTALGKAVKGYDAVQASRLESASKDFLGYVDHSICRALPQGRCVEVNGWVLNIRQRILQLWIGWEDENLIPAFRKDRADVGTALPWVEHANQSGYQVWIPVPQSIKGGRISCRFSFLAQLEDGSWEQGKFAPRRVELDAGYAALNPPHLDELAVARRARYSSSEGRLHAFQRSQARFNLDRSSKPPILSVLIPSGADPVPLFSCLSSLKADWSSEWELILVNQEKSPGLLDLLSRIDGARHVSTVSLPGQLDWVADMNLAARAAQGKYFLFLDPDCEVPPGAIGSSLRFFENRASAGAFRIGHLAPDGRQMEEAEGFLMTSAEAFRSVAGLNPELSPGFFSELELFLRIRASGFEAVEDSGMLVSHQGDSPWQSWDDRGFALFSRNRLIYLRLTKQQGASGLRTIPFSGESAEPLSQ